MATGLRSTRYPVGIWAQERQQIAKGAKMEAAEQYPSGGIIWCGYWGVYERVLSFDENTGNVEVQSLSAVNGGGRILAQPEPARVHCTSWNAKHDRIVTELPQ